MARRRKNPSTAAAVASGLAPLVPYVLLAGVGYYLYRKFASSAVGAALLGGGAHAATAVPEAYGQAARTALDPSQWPAAYEQAQQAYTASGGQGSPIGGAYYGPAGPWSSGDYEP